MDSSDSSDSSVAADDQRDDAAAALTLLRQVIPFASATTSFLPVSCNFAILFDILVSCLCGNVAREQMHR
jgi:hypothetical protein